jgi:hypothetical protein
MNVMRNSKMGKNYSVIRQARHLSPAMHINPASVTINTPKTRTVEPVTPIPALASTP